MTTEEGGVGQRKPAEPVPERTRTQRKGTDFLMVEFSVKAHEHLQMISEHLKNNLTHDRRTKDREACKTPEASRWQS